MTKIERFESECGVFLSGVLPPKIIDVEKLNLYMEKVMEERIISDPSLSDMEKNRKLKRQIVMDHDTNMGTGEWVCESSKGKFQGQIQNGLPNGVGSWVSEKATYDDKKLKTGFYVGYWRNGLREGNGEYTAFDGTKYVGQWKNSMKCGHGKYIYNSGDFYEGEFHNDKEIGCGVFYWRVGAVSLRNYDQNHVLKSETILSVDDIARFGLDSQIDEKMHANQEREKQLQDEISSLKSLLLNMRTEHEKLKEVYKNESDKLCKMCYENPIQVLHSPCGHSIYCSACFAKENPPSLSTDFFSYTPKRTFKNCPACREKVENVMGVQKIPLT
eukprot:TRINITY_DN3075_c0_g1_i2.p1 TRINITY_DN3075_c0_g1~~TRINITY_DN3075_c0_g1_i2.p1  ORF type:complete len:329 (-),score=59.71 TRINITY_DN3075_c0_g1_i2:97-1083(-)